jgi:hypothetical protein
MGTLNEQIEKLTKEIKAIKDSENVKEKKWKFPFGKKVGKAQKKKNYVTTLVIYENGHYEFKKYQINDQTLIHDVIPRLANAGYTLFDKKGNPLIILPNWSVEPFSTLTNYQQSLDKGTNTNGYKILMAKMHQELVGEKKKIGSLVKWIFGLGVASIIIYAIFTSGGS